MKKVTSISGGQSSAYVMANFPSDFNVFALVRTNAPELKWMKGKDEKTRKLVEDRIQKPFIGTLEDDQIIYTILDLEQYTGKPIKWVSGETFEWIIENKGGWLPNKLHRYCTSNLKIEPMFYWWASEIGKPIEMQIGYRANKTNRQKTMLEKVNSEGLLEFEATFGKHKSGNYRGRNKWETIAWQKPVFPMIDAGVYRDEIVQFWKGKKIRFAWKNNCVHCFHQNPILLRKRFETDPLKIQWAANQEGNGNGTWRNDVSYSQIMQHNLQTELTLDDFSDCDSGYCSL